MCVMLRKASLTGILFLIRVRCNVDQNVVWSFLELEKITLAVIDVTCTVFWLYPRKDKWKFCEWKLWCTGYLYIMKAFCVEYIL